MRSQILVKGVPYKQHYDYHYSWYMSILPLDKQQKNLCCYTLDKVYPLICNFWSDDQFYCMCNIYIQVYLDWYNLLRLCFLSLIVNPPFSNSDLSELLTKLKVTKVIAVPSAFVLLIRFLIGISLSMNAPSMSSNVAVVFTLLMQNVELEKVLVDSSTVMCFLVSL